MDLVEGRRPDFAEERDALDDRGIAAWKLIIHNGIAENYYAMGAASPDRESRKGYYDLASKACHNVLEAAENAYLDISLGAIISSCARLTALTAEDTSASDYCFPAKYYLNKWLRRLQRDPKGLSPEDEEKSNAFCSNLNSEMLSVIKKEILPRVWRGLSR